LLAGLLTPGVFLFKEVVMDAGSILVMVVTFILFVLAVFFKGVTHDLLLEAGVFLVSVKLIIMTYKNNLAFSSVQQELAEIKTLLSEQKK
jgi:hypothetical protein